VRLRGVREFIGVRDRDLEIRLINGAAEALELANAGDGVVRDNLYAAPLAVFRTLTPFVSTAGGLC
jgi:hypothetical protein